MSQYAGGCHCGKVRFETELDLSQPVTGCNCSFCTKRNARVVIVKPAAFRLISGEDNLARYSRTGGPNHFAFCKDCGIHAFGRGHLDVLGGDFVAVNVNCLDAVDPAALKVVHFDGRHNNWMAGTRDTPWPI